MRVTLKLATSLDGRIATGSGESRWITGEGARAAVHRLRSEHDAVLVGVETAVTDDPELTVRLPDYSGRQPARVVLDSRQRLARTSKLVTTARETPTFVVSTTKPDSALVAAGVRVLQASATDGDHADLKMVIQMLEQENLSSIFVEGGGQVAASFLRGELVDAIEWFRAPILIGDEGRAAVAALAIAALADAPHFRRTEVLEVGCDLWERYVRI
jgi:diaminohydroxyphosphoribosylaminopyrimidine deaminase/5-amino-6-(5-phosphoribosylamino)uracil reductase